MSEYNDQPEVKVSPWLIAVLIVIALLIDVFVL